MEHISLENPVIENLAEIIKAQYENKVLVFNLEIKKGKCSGYIYLPKKLAGKKCKIIVENSENEDNPTDTQW